MTTCVLDQETTTDNNKHTIEPRLMITERRRMRESITAHTFMIPIPWVYGIGFAFRDTQIPICLGATLRLGEADFPCCPQYRVLLSLQLTCLLF